MKAGFFFLLPVLFLPAIAFARVAEPVPISEDHTVAPQVEFSGVGIGTLAGGRTANEGPGTNFNFSDSSLLFGAAERLFDEAIGSFSLGGITTDTSNRGTGRSSDFFIHQAVLSYQSKTVEATVGRTDNPISHFIDFPLLRGDDLVTLTNPVNPFSNGRNSEEHRFANVAGITFNQNLTTFENVHVEHLINSAGIGSTSGINSFGASFQCLAPPGLENFSAFPLWGVGFEHLILPSNSSAGLNQIYAGAVINLNKSVTGLWDFRLQDTLSFGSSLTTFSSTADSFQANSNALAASLSYDHRPFGEGGYQLALTAALKNYFDIPETTSVGGALSFERQLGSGFSAVAQYQGQWRAHALAAVQASDVAYENTFEIGLLFSFDAILNQHLMPRRTLLNQKYQYVPN